MKTAVITGITGQDGAFLAKLLLSKGYRIIGVVRTSTDRINTGRLMYLGIADDVILKACHLEDMDQVVKLIKETEPDEIYNLAAQSSVSLSFHQPVDTVQFNIRSVMNLLESIRQIKPSIKFYQASSSEMFGSVGQSQLPIKESFLFHPVSPYGISKASAHWLTVNYREAYKLKTCCGILFNHESALRPSHYVIKKIIHTAIQIKNGSNQKLTLGNVSVTRDWGYAPLYVDAMWRMMQQEVMSDYLICSGIPISLEGFVTKVFNNLNLTVEDHLSIDSSLMRSLDLEIIYGDNTKAKKALEWEYNLTTDDLVARLIKDEIEFMNWESKNA